MARVVITLKIMPESPEIDLNNIESEAKTKIQDFSQTQETKTEQEPIAFGLKALKITFVIRSFKRTTRTYVFCCYLPAMHASNNLCFAAIRTIKSSSAF